MLSMNQRHFAVLLLALAVAPVARGAEQPGKAPDNATASAADAQHVQLAKLAGRWQVRQRLWPRPGQAPQVDAGVATFTPVLGGRHLRQELRIDSRPPFQGLGYIGYDTATRRYFTTWMDVNFTGLLVMQGDFDPARTTYRFRGEMADAQGDAVPTREELQLVDDRHFVARFFETRNGVETLVVQLEYSRPGSDTVGERHPDTRED
jgi:hypothetical protein